MDNRAYEANASATPPTAPVAPSSGYPKPGNPATSDPATKPGPYWVYAIGEEVRNLIVGAGLTPDINDLTQIRQAVVKLISDAAKAIRIDSATFEASVADGEAVRWDSANSRFDEAIADGTTNNQSVGFADVTNSRVYVYGETPALFSGLTPGARYYLDATTAGAVTATKPTDGVIVGIAKSATTMFVDIDIDPANSLPALGQCQLAYVSSTQIALTRKNGKKLTINGTAQDIPSAGVTLANTGLTAATLYYAYAYMNAGVMTLEASATGHSTDSSTGVEIKTGDATRTLVGMVYMGAGTPGTFVDSATQRFVRSWFNRKKQVLKGNFTASRSTSSNTYVELNTEIRVEAVLWNDDLVNASSSGTATGGTSAMSVFTAISTDGATAQAGLESAGEGYSAGSHDVSTALSGPISGLAEGKNFFTLLGRATANTGTWSYNTGAQRLATTLMVSF